MAEAVGCIFDEKRGYACHTWTGKALYPADIRPEDVDIRDIAHGLSMTVRFRGQCDFFYSVAQHSVYAYDLAPPEYKREALLHDAAEYILGDFARPHKMQYPGLVEIEDSIAIPLHRILGIPAHKSEVVGKIDNLLIATEMNLLFQKHGFYRYENGVRTYMGNANLLAGLPEPMDWVEIPRWTPEEAEEQFLEAYYLLEKQGL